MKQKNWCTAKKKVLFSAFELEEFAIAKRRIQNPIEHFFTKTAFSRELFSQKSFILDI